MLKDSRVLRLAEQVASYGRDQLRARLEESQVYLTVDSALPNSWLTARVFLTTLCRLPGTLYLASTNVSDAIADEFEEAVFNVAPKRPLVFTSEPPSDRAIRMHIGLRTQNAVRLIPEGYGGHVVRGTEQLVLKRPANELGAIYTASLGAAEAFKMMAGVLPSRRIDHRHLQFCPVTLSTDLYSAPCLRDTEIALTMVGLGAVGTGIALILSQLPISGKALLVDRERYAIENVETYSLGSANEVGKWKTEVAANALKNFDSCSFDRNVGSLIAEIDGGNQPAHAIVLSAVDSIEARHDVQRLWPQNLIDAATGDTMLGIYDVTADLGPCLMCFLPGSTGGPSAALRLAEFTGLSVHRTACGDDPLTMDDLAALSEPQRARLVPFVGTKVCGLAQALGLTELDSSRYQPSVPFVSLQAACLSVGRLLSRLLGRNDVRNLIQYDALIGPQFATIEQLRPLRNCYCQQRSNVIKAVRALRY